VDVVDRMGKMDRELGWEGEGIEGNMGVHGSCCLAVLSIHLGLLVLGV
jgi:hypothetical protein